MTEHSVGKRTVVGLIVGVILATVPSAWVALTHAGAGKIEIDDGSFSWSDAIVAYYLSGIIGGALAGAASSLGNGLGARLLTGFCATAPFAICLVISTSGSPLSWNGSDWLLAILLAVGMAVAVGTVNVASDSE